MRKQLPGKQTIRHVLALSRRPLVRLLGIAVLAIALLSYGGIGLWERYRATHNPLPVPDAKTTIVHSTDKPDETTVPATAPYDVPDDQPKAIAIPSIGASGIVQKVGIDQHNAIAVPTNVSVAGWYTLGARPGDKGVSLIDGHVQGRFAPGIFKRLQDVRPGQEFTVTFGDGSQRQFKVVRTTMYDVSETAKHMLEPVNGIEAQLNLITCGGTYNKTTKQYDKRVLVIAKRVS